MPEPTRTDDRGWRAHWPVAVLAALAGLGALWAHRHLYPAYSWNRDEPVYLWHVEVLRSGRLTAPDGGHPTLFHPWLSARGEGSFFTQYTLGWPLALLAALRLTGTTLAALPVGAALAVVGTYAFGLEVLRDRRTATVGAALLVASPVLPIQGGAYLSYLFTLGLGLLAGTALLSGIRRGRTGRVVASGALLGWIFLTRPYDALLWGAAFSAYALWVDPDRRRRALRSVVVCATAAVPCVVVTLAYNRHVTGSWLQFPITAADPLDTFGFGPHRLMPTFEVVDYSVGKALRATAKNAFLLPWFLAGGYLGVLLAAWGLWLRRHDRAMAAMVLVGAAFPVGYFVFWGNHLSSLAARISAPIYFIPLYTPICLLAASVLVRWWVDRRRVAVIALAALAVITVPLALNRFDANRDISVEQAAWRDSLGDLPGRPLVFVADSAPYLLYLNPFSANDPDLDGPILYAVDGDPAMLDLIAERPDRTPYLQQGSVPSPELGPREEPEPLDVTVTPVVVRTGRSVTLTITLARQDARTHLRVEVTTGAGAHRVDVPPDGTTDPVVLRVRVAVPGTSGDVTLADRGLVSVAVGQGPTSADAATGPRFRADTVYRVVEGEAEVLLPLSLQRRAVVDGEPQWRRAVSLDVLDVQVDADPAS